MRKARVRADFVAESQEELSVSEGCIVEVVEAENSDGWAVVSYEGKTGLFPPDYLEEVSETEDESKEENKEDNKEQIEVNPEEARLKHRRNVIKEIKSTEEDYIKDLEIVTKVFMEPCRNILTPQEFNLLYSNLAVLLPVNIQFNDRLKAEQDEDSLLVGKITSEMSDFFKVYAEYCSNQPKAMAILEKLNANPSFKNLCAQSMENPECRGLTLFSFLIKPIQRICKYPLLLKDLYKNTTAEHPDYAFLEQGLNKIETVVEYVNERKRTAENLQKIVDVQDQIESTEGLNLVSPSRRFVREGALKVLEKGKPCGRKVYLFNDLIVITKTKKNIITAGQKKEEFKYQLSLNQAKITDVADTEVIQNACQISPQSATNNKQTYVFIFETPQIKASWLGELKALIKEFQKKQLKEKKAQEEAILSGNAPAPPPIEPPPEEKVKKNKLSLSRRERRPKDSLKDSKGESSKEPPSPTVPQKPSPSTANRSPMRNSLVGGTPVLPTNSPKTSSSSLLKNLPGKKKAPTMPPALPSKTPPTKPKSSKDSKKEKEPAAPPKTPPIMAKANPNFNNQLANVLAARQARQQ